jgi:hypothetical protein
VTLSDQSMARSLHTLQGNTVKAFDACILCADGIQPSFIVP